MQIAKFFFQGKFEIVIYQEKPAKLVQDATLVLLGFNYVQSLDFIISFSTCNNKKKEKRSWVKNMKQSVNQI